MKPEKNNFRHESIQDLDTIGEILDAITRGIKKGELLLSDEEGEMKLHPQGLLHLKVTGSQSESEDRLNLRISWQKPVEIEKRKRHLRVK